MALTLIDVRRIAVDVARNQDPALQVVAAMPAEGESMYTEVMLTVPDCRNEPCQLIVGLNRDISEQECRRAVSDRLQQHFSESRLAPGS